MPSFDTVSEVDHHEIANAVDQADRAVSTRFDFKTADSSFELDGNRIALKTESEFQLSQMLDILYGKLSRRGVDLDCVQTDEPEVMAKTAAQAATIREGIDAELAKKIVKLIKDSRLKVQAAIQGEQVRVTGKKRDDLQAAMKAIREAELGRPLQFRNFRD